MQRPKLVCFATALLLAVSFTGCRGTGSPDVAGSYYAFANGGHPTSTTYSRHDLVVMKVTFSPNHTWSMDVVMAEHPFTGPWSQQGNRVTLEIAGHAYLVLAVVGRDELKAVDGAAAQSLPGPLWKMPAPWVQSLDRQSAVDATVTKAWDLAEVILIEAGTKSGSMAQTQQELERRLRPYLRNGEDLSAFTCTYKGAKLPPARQRAKAPLGYVVGTGGRAILFADGDAKWRPN